jgi:mannose-1-phosphate guanylyltransferase
MLPGGETLLGATVRRTLGVCALQNTLIVTTAEQVQEVRRCLPDLPVENILVEPIGRNTAPCIGLAALAVIRREAGGDAVMAVLPSDHYVKDEATFQHLLKQALDAASHGHVVTLGVRPTRPETGFGYIKLEKAEAGDPHEVRLASAFVEKPSHARAVEYVDSGDYLWNSGMFFFPAQRILSELRGHLPPLGKLLDELYAHPELTAARYNEAPAISIDYAVMEKLGAATVGKDAAIRVLAGDFGWNDVGSFAALSALIKPDEEDNHVVPQAHAAPPVLVDAHDNIIWNSGRQMVAALGVDGLCIAVTEDAVLILPQRRAQDVREVVARLQSSGRSELL